MGLKTAVVIASDETQFPAAVFLASRLLALRPGRTQVVIATDYGRGIELARQILPECSFQRVRTMKGLLPSWMPRISGAAFLRYYLPEILGKYFARILYLDTDTYPDHRNIFRLLNMDMEGHSVAAVRDIKTTFGRSEESARELSHAGPSGKYLNSGVLLIDNAAWTRQRLVRKVMEAVNEHGLHDQAALNYVLRGDWLELSPLVNMTIAAQNTVFKGVRPLLTHFMGLRKPWSPIWAENHRARREMVAFLRGTPWPYFIEPVISPQPAYLDPDTDFAGVRRYVETTEFADVKCGISRAIQYPASTRAL